MDLWKTLGQHIRTTLKTLNSGKEQPFLLLASVGQTIQTQANVSIDIQIMMLRNILAHLEQNQNQQPVGPPQ